MGWVLGMRHLGPDIGTKAGIIRLTGSQAKVSSTLDPPGIDLSSVSNDIKIKDVL